MKLRPRSSTGCATAGLTAAYYHHGEPMTGLFASRKYDDITYPIEQFCDDATRRRARQRRVRRPRLHRRARRSTARRTTTTRTAACWWPRVSSAHVHDALDGTARNGTRMVFVLNFDENGGFFDHVPPPACEDDTVLAGDGPFPDLKRLGFRVPAIAMGPFAPAADRTGRPLRALLDPEDDRVALGARADGACATATPGTSRRRSTSRPGATRSSSRPSRPHPPRSAPEPHRRRIT